MKFSVKEIIPKRLYQRGEFWKLASLIKAGAIHSLGVGSVVCLTNKRDRDMEELLGTRFVYLPIPDGKVVNRGVLFSTAVLVGDWMEEGTKVLCHCRAGRNRSSLFSALLAIRLLGISGRESVKYLREKRPRALDNDHFVEFLEGITKYSKKRRTYV